MIQYCVSCDSQCHSLTEEWEGYQLSTCSECGITFTLNPDYNPERYISAYENPSQEAPGLEKYGYTYGAQGWHLKLGTLAFYSIPSRLTPAERLALKWLKSHAPVGASIIDCGCGVGRFLHALQKSRFQGVGLEVSTGVVKLLNLRGLKAIEGLVPDFQWDGPEPFAITFFEVLEHLPNPGSVIDRLKKRFPSTYILASVPSPSRPDLLLYGRRSIADYPPHHFLRWTPTALDVFFQRLGYSKVTVQFPAPIGSEVMPGLGQVFALLSRPQRTLASKESAALRRNED